MHAAVPLDGATPTNIIIRYLPFDYKYLAQSLVKHAEYMFEQLINQ